MEFLHELFLTACMAAVFSLIVGVSIALSSPEEKRSSMEEVRVNNKGSKVVGGKSKKKVKFVDDVVVRDVNRFDYEKESSKDVNLVKKLDGILADRLEEEILSRDEVRTAKVTDKVEFHGVDEESEGIVSGGKIFGDMNVVSNLKHVDVLENVLGVIRPIDEVLEKEMEEEKAGDVKVGEFILKVTLWSCWLLLMRSGMKKLFLRLDWKQ